MDLQKYHNVRLEFHLPAVHDGYSPGDPVYAARGVALMTVSGSDVLLHPLEGPEFRPLSGLPFLHLLFSRSSSTEGEENTIFRAGPHPSYFGSMVEDGLRLVFDDTVDRSKHRIDVLAHWENWSESNDALSTESPEE